MNTASLTNLSYHIPFRLPKALLSYGHSECQMQLLHALEFFGIYFHVQLFLELKKLRRMPFEYDFTQAVPSVKQI